MPQGKPLTQAEHVRQLFQKASDACYLQTGIRVRCIINNNDGEDTPEQLSDAEEHTRYFDRDGNTSPAPGTDRGDGFAVQYSDFETGPESRRHEPRFNIGDIVCFNSGGAAMNVANVNNLYPVVECIWTDLDGTYFQEVIPESCLRVFQEGSN